MSALALGVIVAIPLGLLISKNKRISLTTSTSKEQDLTAEKYMSSQSDDGDTYNPFAALLKK